MYWFLLKPRWILSHIFVLACVVAFVNLGIWQLHRLDERKAANAEVRAAQAMEPVTLDALLPAGTAATQDDVDAGRYRAVVVTGTYRPDQEVLIRNRTNGGAPGYWVITPLVQSDGTAVAVNRGWVPYSYDPEGSWTDFDPPSGEVTVTGTVQPSQVRDASGLVPGPEDAATGTLRTLSRVDVARLAQQIDEPVVPAYVDLRVQSPAQPGELPVLVPDPDLSEGPHLSYAGQWFLFALMTLIVYPLLLRRVARRRLQGEPTEDDELVDLSQEGALAGVGPDGRDPAEGDARGPIPPST